MAKSVTKKEQSKVSKKDLKKKQEEKKDVSSSSSSEDESSSSDSSSSSSDNESSDSDSSSDSSDDESSSEEQEKKEEKKGKKEDAKKTSNKEKSDASSSSSESSSDSDDSSSSSSSDSDESSSSESSDDAEKEEKTSSKKRKSEETAEETAEEESETKKPKLSGEPATIFVGRLSWNIDGEWLKSEFEHIGGVVDARVIYERGTDRSRGYGYVDFEDMSYAEKAIKEMQDKEIDGRAINCDMSTSKPKTNNGGDRAKKFGDVPSEPSDTLFLGNLSFDADRDELFEIFGKHGDIISVRLPTNPETNQPKGFGYVQYGSIDDAKKALEVLQGEYINNRPVRLDYSTPRPNNDRGNFRGGRNNDRGNFRGGRNNDRGSFRGGRNNDRGNFRGGNSGKGANNIPLGKPRQTAEFKGQKKTFD
ncbi:Nsr1p SCDLUD_001549 [Saccharomycodes ludwigii]|uniref:Nsr1p n=1 Tax=Saccharomycodes ludwigii TaxID=36035 RepID=UPI001E89E94D|nr:hypothetical protein SCDLUD_001549 [Saccharomycodes ludwigii]KAH3901771.1 hypothetical protein SCDLUD_001549 [Saccharomycodes ludwigii]